MWWQHCLIYCNQMYTWNPNDPCFEWKGPSFGWFKPQNRGQTGSTILYIYVYIYIYSNSYVWLSNSSFFQIQVSSWKKYRQNAAFHRGTTWLPGEPFLRRAKSFWTKDVVRSDERSLGVIYKSLVIGTPESSKITGLVVDLSRDFFGLKQKLCCITLLLIICELYFLLGPMVLLMRNY